MVRLLILMCVLFMAAHTAAADTPDAAAAIAWLDSLNGPPVVYAWQLDKTESRPVSPTAKQRFNGIVALDLGGEDIVDDDLKNLVGMPKLQRLALRHTTTADKGLATVAKIPTITHLNLSDTKISWRAYPHLAKMPNLTHLELRGMWDVYLGWDVLRELKGLRLLDMRGCRLAPSAFDPLRKALPDCEILPKGAGK